MHSRNSRAAAFDTVTPRHFLARLKIRLWLRGRSPGLWGIVLRLPKFLLSGWL